MMGWDVIQNILISSLRADIIVTSALCRLLRILTMCPSIEMISDGLSVTHS